MPHVTVLDGVDLEYERKGLGRPLVLLGGKPKLRDALAARFEVFSFPAAEADALRVAFEQLRLERPLIVALERGEVAFKIAERRMPRGIVIKGKKPAESQLPVLSVTDTKDVAALAERLATFDAPLK